MKDKPDGGGQISDASADSGTGGAMTGYCPADSPNEGTLVTGLSAAGKVMTGKFVMASPNPPERYDNQWVVDFVDADGNPVEDVQVIAASTHMPFHNHPDTKATSSPMTEPGRFKVKLYFGMKGYFEIKFSVHSPSLDMSDSVILTYCLR